MRLLPVALEDIVRDGRLTEGLAIDALAKVTCCGSLLDDWQSATVDFLVYRPQLASLVDFLFREAMHIDIAIGAVVGTQSTTDAIVFDLDF